MKHIFSILALVFVTSLVAQNDDIEKTIGEFTEVKVYDLIEVELIKSKEDKVVISGKNSEDVVVINKNGKLKIKMKLKEKFDGNNTTVALYYTNIETIDANEGAVIFSEDVIKQYEVDLKSQEGGKIEIPVNVKYLNIKAVTGGIVEVKGKAERQDISINTGGVSKTKEVKTETVKVAIRAGGEAEVNATELVDVNIRAGGDVYVYGDPKTIKENRIIGGRVKRMK
ncbi:DUF2807 domain-containing protein [Flavobacteriaceae bacterium AU392]|nr:DUF2807 domain-containing protein [Flavobacteriaceae bacterium]RKM84819.1 DUF2807 domain-containing protein [Flavobacteriaceae bacterium AU392]